MLIILVDSYLGRAHELMFHYPGRRSVLQPGNREWVTVTELGQDNGTSTHVLYLGSYRRE